VDAQTDHEARAKSLLNAQGGREAACEKRYLRLFGNGMANESACRQHPKGADMEFEENLFVTIVLVLFFLVGVGICYLIGLVLLWIRDRCRGLKRRKRLLAVVGRIL
jgi:hypothetical protein